MAGFSDSLRSWDEDALVDLLSARPDLALPPPGSLVSLSLRATNRASLERALAGLDAFALQVLESVVALAPVTSPTSDRVASAISDAPAAAVTAALERLAGLALIWPNVGTWQPAPGLSELFGPYPAGLGPVLPHAALPQNNTPASARTTSASRRTSQRAAPKTGSSAHPSAPLSALDSAPPGARKVLESLLWTPVGRVPAAGDGAQATAWLVSNGFLLRSDTAHVVVPRPVGLALREGRTFAASAHEPPVPQGREFTLESVDEQAASAADEAVHAVAELLGEWEARPAAVLRAGGVGVRDLRRLAAVLEVDEQHAALCIELAAAAGLVADDDAARPHFRPTAEAEAWLAAALAERWAALARAWWTTNRTPWLVGSRDARGTLFAALGPGLSRPWVSRLRGSILTVLADRPGVALSAEQVVEVLSWRTPRSVPPRNAVVELLAEAHWLGVLGLGALGSPGRALVLGEDIADALDAVLPAAVDEVLLQADLTGIVPGRPTGTLMHLLDLASVVESRGGALTVRFTDQSIRAALDSGLDGTELLASLARHSRTGVPQPLEYLVRDVARRHGRLRVGGAQSFVRAEEPSLLVGLAEDARLRALGLRLIAPTVLTAQVPQADLLDALREHGLAPVLEDPSGGLVSSSSSYSGEMGGARGTSSARRRRQAASAADRSAEQVAPVVRESDEARGARLGALAARLRADGVGSATRAVAVSADEAGGEAAGPAVDTINIGERTTDVGREGTTEPATALTRLREAIDSRSEVLLEVIGPTGTSDVRRVRPLTLESGRLRALDVTREAELTVAVHRIARVTSDPS